MWRPPKSSGRWGTTVGSGGDRDPARWFVVEAGGDGALWQWRVGLLGRRYQGGRRGELERRENRYCAATYCWSSAGSGRRIRPTLDGFPMCCWPPNFFRRAAAPHLLASSRDGPAGHRLNGRACAIHGARLLHPGPPLQHRREHYFIRT